MIDFEKMKKDVDKLDIDDDFIFILRKKDSLIINTIVNISKNNYLLLTSKIYEELFCKE